MSILLSFSFATTFLVFDLSENYYVEISNNSDHFLNLNYLISLKHEGGASANSLKFSFATTFLVSNLSIN